MITIYDDGYHSNAHVHIALAQVTDVPTSFCTASMILDGWLEPQKLIIMPGGADLFNCEKLNGRGNRIIREFVANGGSYLGICAGAYYGCSALDWNDGEIDGSRELAFTNAIAIGPVDDFIENKDSIYEGSWIKAVEIETVEGQKFLSHYNGGPVFEPSPHPSSHKRSDTLALKGEGKPNEGRRGEGFDVIAKYTTLDKPAIIGGDFGKGKYILSSPHIEIFGHLLSDRLYKLFNNSYEREKKEIDKLLPHERAQKQFLKNIIEQLL